MNRRWLLVPIAISAGVAVWSGWVGLGGLCGFGPVDLLPGIGSGFTINTAVTLPIGVEAYGAFALGAYISGSSPDKAKAFAKWSALGALAYGMLGQVMFHLLVSRGYTEAPWPVVVVVSCMPVAVLGFAAALAHLLGADERGRGEAQEGDGSPRSPATTEPARDTQGQPPSQWLDDQIMALLSRMSLRSTADAFGVSKTRVETAKRRAALAASESPAMATHPAGVSGRDDPSPRSLVPAAQSNNGHQAARG